MTELTGGPGLTADVGIVGAGPGGLAAARELVLRGVSCTILDEGQRPGGQIFRQVPAGFREGEHREPPSHAAGHRLLQDLRGAPLRILQGAVVWDAAPGHLAFEHDGLGRRLECRAILLAPGAYDRCIPFPGWTLPGVITAGAAQVLVRGFRVKPGNRALVAGTGPLLLPTVTALLEAGVEVVAALEACSRWRMLRALPGVLLHAARRREAFWYARALVKRGMRLRTGWTVFEATGDGRVERAVIGRVDGYGRPLRDTARAIEVDVVCAGFGLVPSIEAAQVLGCAVAWNAVRGGWTVETDDWMGTSVSGVWAAGEIAGVGGAEVAMAEGALAAHAILAALRREPVPEHLVARRRSERRAADAMLSALPLLPGLHELARDDTLACRCEDVTVAEVRAAAELHGPELRDIKMGCRAGMGPCQGRICSPNLEALADPTRRGRAHSCPVAQLPIKPVSVETMLG